MEGKGCNKCGIENTALKNKKTTDYFIKAANNIHGDTYDYSLVEYITSSHKVKIICKKHGEFIQTASSHLSGHGCKQCSIITRSINNAKTTSEFIDNAIKIHGDTYDYSLVEYKNCSTKINIICKEHKIFEQRPQDHLAGKGCCRCANEYNAKNRTKTTSEFIDNAIKIHGSKYDYTLVDYKSATLKIKIICKTHGIFEQKPNNHLSGHNCPKCANLISKPETAWLDSLNIPMDKNHRQVKILNYTVDGYDPLSNTIYEFHGDFWHGNPAVYDGNKINPRNKKTYSELYKNTIKKEILLKEAGFNLVIMWESDWKIKTAL